MKIIELIIDDKDLVSGIDAISLVERPAIEENFIALRDESAKYVAFKTIDEEKRLLVGACLIPDKPIYRFENDEEFYVYFTKDTIRRASEMFFKMGKQNRTTLEHEMMINGLCVVESWIVEDVEHDKSTFYGLSYPVGTWVVSMKVENDDVWNDWVKTGRVKGFSIEGFFVDRATKTNQSKNTTMSKKSLLAKIVALLSDETDDATDTKQEFEQATLSDGSTIVADKFETGSPVYIVTEDGQLPLPVGECALEDGRVVVVTEEGVIAEVRPKEDATADNADNADASTEMSEDEKRQYETFKSMFERYVKERQNAEIDAMIADLESTKAELASVKAELASMKDAKPKQEFSAPKKITVSPSGDDVNVVERVNAPKGATILSRVMERIAN